MRQAVWHALGWGKPTPGRAIPYIPRPKTGELLDSARKKVGEAARRRVLGESEAGGREQEGGEPLLCSHRHVTLKRIYLEQLPETRSGAWLATTGPPLGPAARRRPLVVSGLMMISAVSETEVTVQGPEVSSRVEPTTA